TPRRAFWQGMASVCSEFRRQNKLSKVDLCSAITYLRKVRGYETEVVDGNGRFRISAVCADARAKPLPLCRAYAKPARVRSRRISLSNSAKIASRPATARPAGVVRSSASVGELTRHQDARVPGGSPAGPSPTGLVDQLPRHYQRLARREWADRAVQYVPSL